MDSMTGRGKSLLLRQAAEGVGIVAEDMIEYGDLNRKFQQSTFGAHLVEVCRYRRDPHPAHASCVCCRQYPQVQVGAQPIDRRHGRWGGADHADISH